MLRVPSVETGNLLAQTLDQVFTVLVRPTLFTCAAAAS
jgi:hypothetical protein